MSSGRWDFWIDRGGTFTDIVARAPDGTLKTEKLLSDNPEHYADAAVEGIRRLLGARGKERTPTELISTVKMGTTVATNALLERKGAQTLLAITKGFADLLRIGTQNRPKIFARKIELPEPLYGAACEIDERIDAQGTVLKLADDAQINAVLAPFALLGYKSIAIVLMHAYRYPAHELKVAAIAKALGFTQITMSHDASALMKIVPRGDTAVADAYLAPVLKRYVNQAASALGKETRLSFMQSSGGLIAASEFRAKDSILSGPAGGIIGMSQTARAAGFDKVIGFDMGGTSTDVSHYAGDYERTQETAVAGIRIRAPMMQIHTVAAGGGSICAFDGMRFRVGPASAGALPGPACYRRSGPLTITDCNVLLGKVRPELVPAVFGANGREPLSAEASRAAMLKVRQAIEQSTGRAWTDEEVAEGFIKIANEKMANAIKQISIQRGYDVTHYTLQCFGGAGGQHACAVADALGITRIMVHPFAGVLSAYGMGLADERLIQQEAVEAQLDTTLLARLHQNGFKIASALSSKLFAQGASTDITHDMLVSCEMRVAVKYEGTDSALEVPLLEDSSAIRAAFEAAYKQRFSFAVADKALIVESLVVEAIARGEAITSPPPSGRGEGEDLRQAHMRVAIPPLPLPKGGEENRHNIFERDQLTSGQIIPGPAIIAEHNATTVIEPGWTARVDPLVNLVIERTQALPKRKASGTEADPILLEVFNNLFMAIAEQMGVALQNTAYSVNIKERLDFSCAIFTHDGALIANAPHMPVHLGSMGQSVKAILAARLGDGRGIRPGDAYALNAPYAGGTHLPDITVIMPVFSGSDELLFFTAARGHHADIGGITPGSMPPDSKSILEEGVLLENLLLVDQGTFRESELHAALTGGVYPARRPAQNIADLKAQIAACTRGSQELLKMTREFGQDTVFAYMRHVQDNAAECVRRVLDRLQGGRLQVPMDNGAVINVAVAIDRTARRVRVDFTGTSGVLPNNFNAPASIARAAVMYVFRTLVDDDIPMNDGCLEPIDIVLPENSLLSPRYPAAVVAGNVETSQAVTDALFGALGSMAAAQGTMNNFTFGDDELQYYETICGGAGAGPDFDGASAVQTHMTNSRLTDPEVIEWRFPVLIEEFSIRQGSGGSGAYKGGDGVRRRIKFRRAMTAGILSNRRAFAPFGLDGGSDGAKGRNLIVSATGETKELGACATVEMAPGDSFVIETPGGGGYGRFSA